MKGTFNAPIQEKCIQAKPLAKAYPKQRPVNIVPGVLKHEQISTRLRAAVNYDPPSRRKDLNSRRQEGQTPADNNVKRYVPLTEAQEIIRRAVDATSPEPARLLPFCETGAQVYTRNRTQVLQSTT